MDKHLIAIVGPTGIGKTSLSIAFAKACNDAPIISTDSRQVYREMCIGTAVPSSEELAAAKHHFIQSHSIHDPLTAGRYEAEALETVTDLFSRHNTIVAVGGSMLYMDALLYGLDDLPKSRELREALEEVIATEGLPSLVQELQRVDPEYASTADTKNPRRVIRALEVYKLTGEAYSNQRSGKRRENNFRVSIIGLNGPRELIYERINLRVDLMMESGLLEEAKSLYEHRDHAALQTVGYQELFAHLDGAYDLEEAVRLIKRNTRRFAKRQLTWYSKNEDVRWVDYRTSHEQVIADLLPR